MYSKPFIKKGLLLLCLFSTSCQEATNPFNKNNEHEIKNSFPDLEPYTQADANAVTLIKKAFPQYQKGKISVEHNGELLTIHINNKGSIVNLSGIDNDNDGKLMNKDVMLAEIPDYSKDLKQKFIIGKQRNFFVCNKIISTSQSLQKTGYKADSFGDIILKCKL